MLYVNSINIVHGSKKKMETCAFKLNIRENKILLSTSGGAMPPSVVRLVTMHISFINACLVLLIVPRSKLVRSEINQNINK